MTRWTKWSWLFLVTVACGSPAPRSAGDTSRREMSGRDMAVELLEVGIGEARPEVIRPLISDDYRQHNPRVPDGPGGLLGFVTEFSRRPPSQRVGVRVLRSFQDGDLVVTHSEYLRRGHQISGFDVFRVRGGRLVEHWDVGMRAGAPNPSGRGLLDGARTDAVSLASDTDVTRAHVESLVRWGLVGRDARAFEDGVAEDCVQHDPRLGDGRGPWMEAVRDGELVHEGLARVIAQGQWALTQSRGRRRETPVVIYDLFRLEGGMVQEHWVVWETIPDRMAHSNGML